MTHKFSIGILDFCTSKPELLSVIGSNDTLAEAGVETHDFADHVALSWLNCDRAIPISRARVPQVVAARCYVSDNYQNSPEKSRIDEVALLRADVWLFASDNPLPLWQGAYRSNSGG